MRNLYIALALSCLTILKVNAQSISPQVFATAGNYYAVGNSSLAFTLGEIAGTTLTSATNKITQGFQQSSYTATAISEVQNPVYDLTIYPNPTDRAVTVLNNGNLFSADAQLFLVDILGRKIISQPLNNKQTNIDLQQLAAGSYFIVIEENGHESFTHKITKVQ